jgi:hypothetical protein
MGGGLVSRLAIYLAWQKTQNIRLPLVPRRRLRVGNQHGVALRPRVEAPLRREVAGPPVKRQRDVLLAVM